MVLDAVDEITQNIELPAEILSGVDTLILIFQIIGGLVGVYLILWIIGFIVNIRRIKLLKRLEDKLDLLNKKIDNLSKIRKS